jgi:class 3 adenylate cyclase
MIMEMEVSVSFPVHQQQCNVPWKCNKSYKLHQKSLLRIGLHIGEIFFEDEKILGDGVNLASRIQSIAAGNSILFSEEIQDKIKNMPKFRSVCLGSFEI